MPLPIEQIHDDELVNSDQKIGVGQREPDADKKKLELPICKYLNEGKAIRKRSSDTLSSWDNKPRSHIDTD